MRTPMLILALVIATSFHSAMASTQFGKIVQPEIRAWISPEDLAYFALFADSTMKTWPAPGYRVYLGDSLLVQGAYDFVWFSATGADEIPFVKYRGTLEAWFEVSVIGVNSGPVRTSPVWAWACSSSTRIKAPPARHFHENPIICDAFACFVVDFPCPNLTVDWDQGSENWIPDTVVTVVYMNYIKGDTTSFIGTSKHPFYVLDSTATGDLHDCGITPTTECWTDDAKQPPIGWGFPWLGKLADPGSPHEGRKLLEAAPNGDVEVGQPRILVESQTEGFVDLFNRGVPDSVYHPWNIHHYPITDEVYLKSGFDIYVLWHDSANVNVHMKIDTLNSSSEWDSMSVKNKVFENQNYFSELPAYVIWDSLRIMLPSDQIRTVDYRCIVSDTLYDDAGTNFIASDNATSMLRVHWMDAVEFQLNEEVCYAPSDTLSIDFTAALPQKGLVTLAVELGENCIETTLLDSVELVSSFDYQIDFDSLFTHLWVANTSEHWARFTIQLHAPRPALNTTTEMTDTTEFIPIWSDCTDIIVENADSACYEPGDTLSVRWDASPFTDTQVSIYISRGGAWTSLATVANGTAPQYMETQEYKWVVQSPTSQSCKIRVDMIGSGNSDTTSLFEIRNNCGGGGGCPYVYVWNGSDFAQDNTILSGSGDSSFVTDRYLLKQALIPKLGEYHLEIREFETERSFFDQFELHYIDHDPQIQLTRDGAGRLLTYRDQKEPLSVRDKVGADVGTLLRTGTPDYYAGDVGDFLELTFDPGDFVRPLGKVSEHCTGELNQNNRQKAEPSIRVQVPDSAAASGWREIEAVHPRENFSSHITDLSGELDNLRADPRIRLFWTAKHDLADVSFVWDSQDPVVVETLQVRSATHSVLKNVSDNLTEVDESGVVLETGESILLTFDAPPVPSGKTRDFLLVSRGLYQTYDNPDPSKAADLTDVSLSIWQGDGSGSSLTISYGLPSNTSTQLDVYSVQGRLVRTLASGPKLAGRYTIQWNGQNQSGERVGSGIYFVRLKAGGEIVTKKTVVLR